ncbi:MAG: DNA primase [Eubacterium sp.]|nr:DNA primase [Eubacterium sp.]
MYYPQEVIDEVVSRNDIVDVVSGYLHLKRSGSNYSCCCPFHTEKTPSFSVNRQKQFFYCFGCHEGGDVIKFVQKYENFSFAEAVKLLADRVGVALPEVKLSQEEQQAYDRKTKLKEINTAAAAYFHYLLTKTERGAAGYKYYRDKRHFTDETIHRFALGYADIYADDLYKYLKQRGFPDDLIRDTGLVNYDERKGGHDVFWNRVMVPIMDINGKCIGFGGRVLGDGKPKYVNTRETELFDKSRNLFAMNIARRSRRKGVILCEGYMDVITQHQAGFDNAVASLGTAFTQGHASLIRRFTQEVYLAYDSDGAGQNALAKAIRILRSMDISQRVIDLSPHKDPDEFLSAEGPEAYEQRIRDAIPGRLYEIRQMAKQRRLTDPEEKAKFIHETAVSIAGIKSKAERASYIESVAEEFRLDQGVLKQEVTRVGTLGLETQPDQSRNPDWERSRVQSRGQAARSAVTSTEARAPSSEDLTEETLITWMVNRPELFGKLKGIISEEDFSAEARPVADELFRQYREEGKLQPALILAKCQDEEEQSRMAGVMSRELPFASSEEGGEALDKLAMEKAITELVRRVKLRRIDEALRKGEGSAFENAKRKRELQKLVITL